MKLNFISDDMINMSLRQMGATKIKSTSARLNIVNFKLPSGDDIVYLYEVKESGSIYLQRVEPYRKMLSKLFDEESVILAIKNDLDAFKNAYNSKNYEEFLNLNLEMGKLDRILEQLFFMYNVDKHELEKLHVLVDEVHGELQKIREVSPPLEYKKDM